MPTSATTKNMGLLPEGILEATTTVELPHNLGVVAVPSRKRNASSSQTTEFAVTYGNGQIETRRRSLRKTASRRTADIHINDVLPAKAKSPGSPQQYSSSITHKEEISVKAPITRSRKRQKVSVATEEETTSELRVTTKRSINSQDGTPFPEWQYPTAEQCEEVASLLSTVHGDIKPPEAIPPPSLTVTGCGEVPSVLDALIRTLLSGATTSRNSAMAFKGLVETFGLAKEGVGRGSVDWRKVHAAQVLEVRDAIKAGGLAERKSKHIKEILDMVHSENLERRKNQGGKPTKLEDMDDLLSLDHFHSMSKEEAMREFVKYPGIGPKTAACVILFCLRRPCFAVDTHVFRLSKWLGWIPPGKGDERTAFRHLEERVPDHLKYSLHQYFVFHGKSCTRCRAMASQSTEGWEKGCVIDHLVKRTRKRKASGTEPT